MLHTLLLATLLGFLAYEYRHMLASPTTALILAMGIPILAFWLWPLL